MAEESTNVEELTPVATFEEAFYTRPATLVGTGASAAGGLVLSLVEAQLRSRIVPGPPGEQP